MVILFLVTSLEVFEEMLDIEKKTKLLRTFSFWKASTAGRSRAH